MKSSSTTKESNTTKESDITTENKSISVGIGDEVYYKQGKEVFRGKIIRINRTGWIEITPYSPGTPYDNNNNNTVKINPSDVIKFFENETRVAIETTGNDNTWVYGKIIKFHIDIRDNYFGAYIVHLDGDGVDAEGNPILKSVHTKRYLMRELTAEEKEREAIEKRKEIKKEVATGVETRKAAAAAAVKESEKAASSLAAGPAAGPAAVAGPLVPSGTTITFNLVDGNNYNGTINKGSEKISFKDAIIYPNGTSDLKTVTFTTEALSSGGSKKYYLNKTKRKRYLGKNGKSRRIK